ncbi:MAG: hypothetical protein KC656_15890, partial [Myxococcales bacterium]|nr:hypothetical protein [Myxococcales bacterium]
GIRRYNLGGGDLAGLVDRLRAEADGGCAPVAEAPGGAALLCEHEVGGRVLHRLHESSGVVVDLRLFTSRWSSARGDEWRALLTATEVRGQPATLAALPAGDFTRPAGPDLSGTDFSATAGPTERTGVVARVWHVDRTRGPVCSNVAVQLPAGWDAWATRHEAAWAVLTKEGYQLISVDVLRDGAADIEGRVRGGCSDFGAVRR